MATASVTNTFVAATPAEAAEVNTNFTDLVTFLNNSTVHVDGSKAMTSNFDAGSNRLVNVASGIAGTNAVNLNQLNAIGGSVSEMQANFTTVTVASNWSGSISLTRWGAVGYLSVSAERTGGNIGATSALIATIGASGRGTFATATQPLTMRSRSASALGDALCWVDIVSGQITMQWFDTWTTGASVTFGGVILIGL